MGDQRTTVKKDSPWIFRTYAGHSSARASNELFRRMLGARIALLYDARIRVLRTGAYWIPNFDVVTLPLVE